jgi:guanosine-3',5'-bis(diphosphate) 3'-pyrophosphohydrolase
MHTEVNEVASLLKALRFAAVKHRDHRRKGPEASPYINHPIEVAELLARVGGVSDVALLQAAILHDTVEDTDTSPQELEREFGPEVRRLVAEVTDDKSLRKEERKRLQIEHAPQLSHQAKQLKIADKICNVRDITHAPPTNWSEQRRIEYLVWSKHVVDGCRGVNSELERCFDLTVQEGETLLAAGTAAATSPN